MNDLGCLGYPGRFVSSPCGEVQSDEMGSGCAEWPAQRGLNGAWRPLKVSAMLFHGGTTLREALIQCAGCSKPFWVLRSDDRRRTRIVVPQHDYLDSPCHCSGKKANVLGYRELRHAVAA